MGTHENVIDGVVVTLVSVEPLRQATEAFGGLGVAAQPASVYVKSIVDVVRDALVVLDRDLRVLMANRSFYEFFRSAKEETESRSLFQLVDRKFDIPALRGLLEEIVSKGASFKDFAVNAEFPRIGRKMMLLGGCKAVSPGTEGQMILLTLEDVTESAPGEKVLKS